MRVYRVFGVDGESRLPREELIEATSATHAIEIGQQRGIFQTDAELVSASSEDVKARSGGDREPGDFRPYDDRRSAAITNETIANSFLIRSPVLAIALGVFLGLVLFAILIVVAKTTLGAVVWEWLN